MGKYFVAVAVSLLFCVATIFAQFSDVVTGMLESPAVTWGEAAYVLACALDEPAEPGDAQAALLLLQERDIAPGGVSVEQGITLAQLSGLCMRTWRLRGGLFYSITGADRYAFRELRAKGILPPGADPSMLVDGFDALNIIHSWQASDGMSLLYSSPRIDFSAYAGYTGFVNSLCTSMVGSDYYGLTEFDVYALSLPYMAFSLSASFPYAFLSQTFAADAWGFVGAQGMGRESIYGTLSLSGRLVGSLYHSTQGTFAVMFEDGSRYGALASLSLDYYLPVLDGMVSAKAAFASEDFRTITETYRLAYGALWQDVLTVGVSASLKPFPSVYIAAGADVSFDASDMGYNGIQVAGSLSWQLASDVSLAASAVHFFASENGSSATDIKVLAFVSF